MSDSMLLTHVRSIFLMTLVYFYAISKMYCYPGTFKYE